jgi:hypothetical protein
VESRISARVTKRFGRIQCLESLRFPLQGLSMEGESRARIMPKGIVDG